MIPGAIAARRSLGLSAACTEMAFAMATGRFWGGHSNPFKQADVGTCWQVRWTEPHDGRLIVRPNDPDEHSFVLVTGRAPEYVVRGYILGRAAKAEAYLDNPNGRAPAYFVPQAVLEPVAPVRHKEEVGPALLL